MIKQLNKWLIKLFGLRVILNTDYEYITNENKFLSNKISRICSPNFNYSTILELNSGYRVAINKELVDVPTIVFPFNPEDKDSKEYAKVCAEDLATALNDALNSKIFE